MIQFKKMKMRINNPDHSKAVQEWLFDQGYFWLSGLKKTMNLHGLYLITSNNGNIGWENDDFLYANIEAQEMDVQHLDPRLYTKQTSPCNPYIKSYHKKSAPKSELEKLSQQLKHLDKAIDSHENKQNKRKKDRERVIQKMEGMLPEGYSLVRDFSLMLEDDITFDPEEVAEGGGKVSSLESRGVSVGSVFECLTNLVDEGTTQGRKYIVKSFDSGGYAEIVNDDGVLTPFWSFHNFKRVA